jgi:hypothetical protein
MLRRHVSKRLRGVNPYPGVRGIRLTFKLVRDARHYYLGTVRSEPAIAASVRRYPEEHTPPDTGLPDVATLTARWERCVREIPLVVDFVHMYLEKDRKKVLLIRNPADPQRLLERLTSNQR